MMRELEWNRALLTMPLTSDTDVSIAALEPQKDILIIYHDINYSKQISSVIN